MPKLVIFDLDGLIVDTERLTQKAFVEVFTEHGYDAHPEHFLGYIGTDSIANCALYRRDFGEDLDAEDMYRKVGMRKMELMERDGLPAKKGIFELLDALDQAGIPRAIASASEPDEILGSLRQIGCENRFQTIVSSKEVAHGKPAPDVYLEVCRRMNVAPENALVLEDSPIGVTAAYAGHIPVICIPDLLPVSEDTRRKCTAVADSLLDVIAYIR